MNRPQQRPLHSVTELIEHARLAWRLFRDGRVPVWTKAIPALTLAYLIWPIDALADPILGLGQLDDLAILVLGLQLFVGVGSSALAAKIKREGPFPSAKDQVIDTTFRVINDQDPTATRRL